VTEHILGLDISTSCTGYCVLSLDGVCVDIGYIRFKQSQEHFRRVQEAENYISKIHREYNISKVFIEQNLQAFRSGFSSSKTLVSLARFNGMVSYSCFQIIGVIPEYINVNTARKTVGVKIDRKSDITTKDQVFDWTKREMPSHVWPVKKLKSGPRKGQEIFDPVCYDMADAYVIARSGWASSTIS